MKYKHLVNMYSDKICTFCSNKNNCNNKHDIIIKGKNVISIKCIKYCKKK